MADSMSKYVFQPHRRGKALTDSAKTIIMNVFVKLREKNPDKSDNEVTSLTSEYTGVSVKTLYRLRTEFKKTGKFTTLGKTRPLKVGTQTRMQKYDEFVLESIRSKMQDFVFRNEFPTATKVQEAVNNDENLPNFSVSTIRRLMLDLGFNFRKMKTSHSFAD